MFMDASESADVVRLAPHARPRGGRRESGKSSKPDPERALTKRPTVRQGQDAARTSGRPCSGPHTEGSGHNRAGVDSDDGPPTEPGVCCTVTQTITHKVTYMPTLNITLSLPQDEIDRIREAASSESLASLTARALRRELRSRMADAYAEWCEALPENVKADLDAWDAAPTPGWDA